MKASEIYTTPDLPSPCFVIDEAALAHNLERLDIVQQRTGCRILLALKGFACFPLFPMLSQTLKGTTASSLNEARLARDHFDGEIHMFSPAYREDEWPDILATVDHIVFNSFSQWRIGRKKVESAERAIACGIRVNPECSVVNTAIYDPCRKHSRLGVTADMFSPDELDGITGLHVHALCEGSAKDFERVLKAFTKFFGEHLSQMKWVNFGGGHRITRPGYDVDRLCQVLNDFKEKHDLQIYLEPGEAVAIDAGVLIATVLDVVRNEKDIAILDTSASTHMPDVLEMPYRPEIAGAGKPGEHPHNYQLAGNTCLAGDVIGEYSFPEPLKPGDRLSFLDMAHYSMVKTTMFNGINLPAIAIGDSRTGDFRVIREFGYDDYRSRLG